MMAKWFPEVSATPAEANQIAHRQRMAHYESELPYDEGARIMANDRSKTYIRGAFLGRGATSSCVLLMEEDTRRCVAGKMFNVEEMQLLHPHRIRRLEREIEIHNEMVHPNIVHYEGTLDSGSFKFMLLEYCSMRSLSDLQRNRGTITEPEARYYLGQMASALEYIHSRSVVHRDLKLRNVLLDAHMRAKICDFGLADYLHERGTLRKYCGTRSFMAPEMILRRCYSTSLDMWSLGCILYQLLVGVQPFHPEQTNDLAVQQGPLHYRPIPTPLSAEAHEMIDALLNNAPELRPTADAIASMPFMLGFTPLSLPPATLTLPPDFNRVDGNYVVEPPPNNCEQVVPNVVKEVQPSSTRVVEEPAVVEQVMAEQAPMVPKEREEFLDICLSWIDEDDFCFWGQHLKDEHDIGEMHKTMTTFYSILAKHELRVTWTPPSNGADFPHEDLALCAVYDERSKGWYRAVYLSQASATKVKVLCLDYGNPLVVEIGDLKQLVEKFDVIVTPPFAVKYRDTIAQRTQLSRAEFKQYLLSGGMFKTLLLGRKDDDVVEVKTFNLVDQSSEEEDCQ